MDEYTQVKSLDRKEKRYLAKYKCAWCNQPLHVEGCGAIYEKCDEETRVIRRAKGLLGCTKDQSPNVKLSAAS